MILSLPLSVTIPRKTKEDKVVAINLNVTRNLHYHVLNQAKQMWTGLVNAALMKVWYDDADMAAPPYLLTYTVYPGSGRAFDIANVCAAVDKFTCDALQELEIIKNDNYKYIPAVNYRFGGIDKENPRCELRIERWEE